MRKPKPNNNKDKSQQCVKGTQQKGKNASTSKTSGNEKKKSSTAAEAVEKLDETRGNNPAWYFTDEKLADQVSQLAFNNVAGWPINYDGFNYDVPNIVRIMLNPCPGVIKSADYGTQLEQNTGVNLAGFKIYSKLSAFTGRVQSYAPQDVSTTILAFGEIISMVEFIRRAFGVAYTSNPRNRDYPRNVLEFGMCINSTDMFTNLSDYRTKFNTLLTLVNQIPIPKNIAYFDKCAALYEKVYLDAESNMAQTLVPVPATTWTIDETSYSGGTILATTDVTMSKAGIYFGAQNLSVYLNTLESMITAMLNSTILTVIYTDIMNYASKISTDFWRFDYLFEDYTVVPEYDSNFMLQMHNATIAGEPKAESVLVTGSNNVTPYNDVYPDASRNALFYNPAFFTVASIPSGVPRTGNEVLVDMFNDSPNVTDRVEVTRYTGISNGKLYQATGESGLTAYIDTTLPDHYIVCAYFETQTSNLTLKFANTTLQPTTYFSDIASLVSNIDWAPRFWEYDSSTLTYTGRYTSDVNYYTTVDRKYLEKLHNFVALALYDLR